MSDSRQFPEYAPPPAEPAAAWHAETPPSARVPRERYWLHILLFLLTFLTTTLVGASHWLNFMAEFGNRRVVAGVGVLAIQGLWFSLTLLAILTAHEFGHYIACRYYRVSASLPYFLPMPFGFFGTFGAVIRIRQPLTTKAKVFDVGVAGPFAGFLVAVPALLVGLAMSTVAPLPPVFSGAELGEPLLFKAAEWLVWGDIPDTLSLNLHPMAFAAWIGLLVTALNLLPVGQLDGGHIAYAVFGRRSLYVTIGAIAVAMGLCFYSSSWIVWTGLLVAMLTFFGWRHPPAWDDHVPLDRTRLVLALVALVVFVVCFTPAPIEPLDLIRPQ
ncbi:MAG: site-2 protease family protein [Vicinamibacterales bacterium]|nr:site-2 protease family protein [Vicinamibacterales bacterium]